MNILFDLDGTLICAHDRLYRLFTDITRQGSLSFDQYWGMKRSGRDHAWIIKNELGKPSDYLETFNARWMAAIESAPYLALDSLFPATWPVLSSLGHDYNLHVVTARQSRGFALQQLQQLGIANFFTTVLVTEHLMGKAELIRKSKLDVVTGHSILVGDTGIDILTAQELGMISVAVLSGFRDRESLESYHPDAIVNGIADVPAVIRELVQ